MDLFDINSSLVQAMVSQQKSVTSHYLKVVRGEQIYPYWGGGGKMAAVLLPVAILDDPFLFPVRSLLREVTSSNKQYQSNSLTHIYNTRSHSVTNRCNSYNAGGWLHRRLSSCLCLLTSGLFLWQVPDNKVHRANMGPSGADRPRWPHELCYLGYYLNQHSLSWMVE